MGCLLAVDVGLRTGLALFGPGGRLLWYRSHNLGTSERLRRAVPRILREAGFPPCLVLEGGGVLAKIWAREAESKGMTVLHTTAEVWRAALLLPRERKDRRSAKETAGYVARDVIAWSGLSRPVRLRHDAAEAIMSGFWACRERGFLPAWPSGLRLQGRGETGHGR